MEEKMEIMKKIAEGVKTECEKNEIEYVLAQSAKDAGEYISHSSVTNTLLKEVIDIVSKTINLKK